MVQVGKGLRDHKHACPCGFYRKLCRQHRAVGNRALSTSSKVPTRKITAENRQHAPATARGVLWAQAARHDRHFGELARRKYMGTLEPFLSVS